MLGKIATKAGKYVKNQAATDAKVYVKTKATDAGEYVKTKGSVAGDYVKTKGSVAGDYVKAKASLAGRVAKPATVGAAKSVVNFAEATTVDAGKYAGKYVAKILSNAFRSFAGANKKLFTSTTRSFINFYLDVLIKFKEVLTESRKLFIALIIIAILAILCIILWILIYHMNPRFVTFCHNENPFEQNMIAMFRYAADLAFELKVAGLSSLRGMSSDTLWQHLAFHYMFAEYIDYVSAKPDVNLESLYYTDLWGNAQSTFPVSDTHAWYGFVKWDKNYIRTTLDDFGMHEVQALVCPNGEVDDAYLRKYVVDVQYAIAVGRQALANSIVATVAPAKARDVIAYVKLCKLNVILNVEKSKLVHGFNMRRPPSFKTGGGFIFQLTLMKVYLSQFARYVFVDQIKKTIWPFYKKFVDAFTNGVANFYKRVGSELLKLFEKMLNEPPATLVEHIGGLSSIIEAFMIIPKFIMLLIGMAKKVNQFFENPIGFLIWIVFVVLLFWLYVLWLIWGAFFVNLWLVPVAVVGALIVCVAWTTLWLLLFAAVLIIFAILIIVDWLTFGHVFVLLRCENTPDSWISRAGYAYENVFEQTIVCSRPCPKGFKPNGAFFCQAIPQGEPPMCPHQYIYLACSANSTTYKKPVSVSDPTLQILPERTKHVPPRSYSYVPGNDYFKADAAKRMEMISEFRDSFVTHYFDSCIDAYRPYDRITRAMCADAYGSGAESMAARTNPGEVEAVKRVCFELYCEFSDERAPFCPSYGPTKVPPQKVEYGSEAPIISKIVVAAFVAVLIILVLAALYFRYSHRVWPRLP
jgi:hypothetical protein